MVASATGDLYSPFQPNMIPEDGPQSSEEGSGLHSPVFGASYAPTHGDSFRYQPDHLDVQQATAVLAPQYDYAQSLAPQQAPILETTLDLPNPSARHVTYTTTPSHFALPQSHRNHLGLDFQSHSSNSRIPHAAQSGGSMEWYASTSERRLPGGPSQETYPRPTGNSTSMAISSDQRPSLGLATERSDLSSSSQTAAPAREPRKETSSVVIACRQCRSRKIRCDSTRPVCNNCVRRNNECQYDAVPKRRGPDKRPGTRQRSCKKRPADGSAPPPSKRKKTSDRTQESRESAASRIKENMAEPNRSPPLPRHAERPHETYAYPHPVPTPATDLRISTDSTTLLKPDPSPLYRRNLPYGYEQGSYIKPSFPRQLDVNILQSLESPHRKFSVPKSPAVETEQKVWWDSIIRNHQPDEIIEEMRFLMEGTGHLLSFINIDFLDKRIWNPEQRITIQPSFILAGLAMAKLMKSSSIEGGTPALHLAINLRNEALRAFDDAWRTGWIDAALAEAALILALFESSAHPDYSHDRAASALISLDRLVQLNELTTIDQNDRDVCHYVVNQVPVAPVDSGLDEPAELDQSRGCSCFPPNTVQSPGSYAQRPYIPPWDSSWTADQIRDEEVRRLCWSSLSLISNFLAQSATFNREAPKFFLSDPSKYLLLFPGEVSDRMLPAYRASDPLSPKESVWALYCRSMLLWNFCNRFREETYDELKAEQVQEAWSEAQAIEDALDMHKCNLDTTLIYTCREHVHNTRMLVTQALRSLQGYDRGPKVTPGPIFKRKQAEDWLYYQDQVIRRVVSTIHQLSGLEGRNLTQRPFRVHWFITQLSICIRLWNHDRTLEDALKLGKAILQVIDVMNALWDCRSNEHQSMDLRHQLTEACQSVGVDLPLPPSYSVPTFIRTT